MVIWEDGGQFGDKPDVVLFNGAIDYDGSGGSHSFTFADGEKIYIVYVPGIFTESSPYGYFDILVDGESVVEEEVWKVLN